MSRPKGIKINKVKKVVVPIDLSCSMCSETKKSTEFYQSNNKLHKTGKVPYCKHCLKAMCFDSEGKLDAGNIHTMLKAIDRPFLYDVLQISISSDADTIGTYFKNISSLTQYKHLTYKDSVLEPQLEYNLNSGIDFNKPSETFIVTQPMVAKWGFGYEPDEYFAFETKYHFLKNNYPEKTSMHTEALLKYIRYSVKEELATAKNNIGEAKSWAGMAKDAATAAKINPSQLSAADLQDGLSTFGQLARAVEQAKDIVPILPRFKERPQDKVDFTLWCYINYIRDIKGLPPCEYKEIYGFYEDRKKEYEERNKEHEDVFDNESEGDE